MFFLAAAAGAAVAVLAATPALAQDARLGTYEGNWSGKIPTKLIISAIDRDGTVHGIYYVTGNKIPFNRPKLDGDTFSFGTRDGSHKQEFTFQGDGSIDGKYFEHMVQKGAATLKKTN
jgi:hypothetical protein